MLKDIILCVDDEPAVLRVCTKAITQAGFRCAAAENGAAGLESFMELKDEVCLVCPISSCLL
jgi:DNA-binding response OmpR family regulator